MAVAYVSDADKVDPSTSTSAVFTTFAVTGTNPTIVLVVLMNSATASVSSVVLSAGLTGGTPYLVKQQRNTTSNMEVWAVPAPTGTGTLTVNYSITVVYQCNAAVFQGVDQTTPSVIADAAATTGSTSPLSVTPANLTANDAVYYAGGNTVTGDGPHTITGTEIFFGNSTTVNMAAGYHLGTGAVSCTWAAAVATEVVVGIRLQAVSTPVTATGSTLLMMGLG